jgi:hypothetical protein
MESLGAALRSLEQLVATNRSQESVEISFKFSLSKCQLDMDVFLKKAGGSAFVEYGQDARLLAQDGVYSRRTK